MSTCTVDERRGAVLWTTCRNYGRLAQKSGPLAAPDAGVAPTSDLSVSRVSLMWRYEQISVNKTPLGRVSKHVHSSRRLSHPLLPKSFPTISRLGLGSAATTELEESGISAGCLMPAGTRPSTCHRLSRCSSVSFSANTNGTPSYMEHIPEGIH